MILLSIKSKIFLKKDRSKIVLPHETFARKAYRKIVPSFVRKIVVFLLKDRRVEIDNIDRECDFDELYEKFFRLRRNHLFIPKRYHQGILMLIAINSKPNVVAFLCGCDELHNPSNKYWS